jgi:hypothetical protein
MNRLESLLCAAMDRLAKSWLVCHSSHCAAVTGGTCTEEHFLTLVQAGGVAHVPEARQRLNVRGRRQIGCRRREATVQAAARGVLG